MTRDAGLVPLPLPTPRDAGTVVAASLPSERRGVRHTPAISGGTLMVLSNDQVAVVSDPDHDVIALVALEAPYTVRTIALQAGDEPGRAVEDAQGRVHVVLRGGGAVATIDPTTGAITARRPVCAAPRGIAWEASSSMLHVACASGDLVSVGATGEPMRRLHLAPDLRDVIVDARGVLVTRFRSAEVLRVTDGALVERSSPPAVSVTSFERRPSVAWRAVRVGDRVALLHQSAATLALGSTPGAAYYGQLEAPTAPIVPRLSWFTPGEGDAAPSWAGVDVTEAAFAVDVAVAARADGAFDAAVASPGWAFTPGRPRMSVFRIEDAGTGGRFTPRVTGREARSFDGEAVAVAWTRAGTLLVQTRAPGAVVILAATQTRVALYSDDVTDAGHDAFHMTTRSGLACASCHPEGGDDGRVWNFLGTGLRRTQTLQGGGVTTTAPFHWGGEIQNLGELCAEVFSRRMGGPQLGGGQVGALGAWLDALRPTRQDPSPVPLAVERGASLFRDPEVGCASCHSGPRYTDNRTVDVGTRDVGTRGAFQVPSLIGVGLRAPYMHDGCAPTLRDRFGDGSCGGGDAHGHTSQLTPSQLDDLVAFLETL